MRENFKPARRNKAKLKLLFIAKSRLIPKSIHTFKAITIRATNTYTIRAFKIPAEISVINHLYKNHIIAILSIVQLLGKGLAKLPLRQTPFNRRIIHILTPATKHVGHGLRVDFL